MPYSIGIDLGTTNCVVAYAALPEDETVPRDASPETQLLPIPQIVGPGQIDSPSSLPSFVYLPREGEVGSLRVQVEGSSAVFPAPEHGVAGRFARDQAAENAQRTVVAAKSWLCHTDIGRNDAVLPWQSTAEVSLKSAVECTERLLTHLAAAWHASHPTAPLRDQRVTLTVPASFDPAARDLTRQAALAAGLPVDFVLLEEPQAAVYCYLASNTREWRTSLHAGSRLLVVDVGGGTTDLTLVGVDEEEGGLALDRIAVGNHLLVGGDNMDLALAHQAAAKLTEAGHALDAWQSVALWHACRDAKERLLSSASDSDSHPVSILGRGSSLIGGTISTELRREEVSELLLEGFFPPCAAGDRPEERVASGFQDIGLPYESDPAITKQVAAFLSGHVSQSADASSALTHVLFNGGVFRSATLRERMCDVIASWLPEQPEILGSTEDLDTAVAVGAAYYGWSKQTGGIRIRGGTARSFYVGIETAGLAIPGAPRPLRAVCVAAQGMEEGSETDVPGGQVAVMVGRPARFRFFGSTTRSNDEPGTALDRWTETELQESEPIELTLTSDDEQERVVPVRFRSCVTELGMFELWCHAIHDDRQWKMEFNAREPSADTASATADAT
ncbi:MAG: Hsp70 family protein [Planctomycetota bacterium]